MPHINDEPPPPARFLTLLVEGDALLGTGSRQRVQVDMDAVREAAKKHSNDEVARRRTTLSSFLAICEAQLVGASGTPLTLTVDLVHVLVYDADAADFVPLLSVEHLLSFDHIRMLPAKPPSRPSSAMVRSSSRGDARASSPNRNESAAPPDAQPSPQAAVEAKSPPPDGSTRPASAEPTPVDARSVVAATAALLRAAGSDPFCLDADLIKSAFSVDAANLDVDNVAAEACAGGMSAVGDLLVSAFGLGRAASVGGVPINPLQHELSAANAQCRGLEAQLLEQAHVLELLQSALLDARLVIESLVAKQQQDASSSPQKNSLSAEPASTPALAIDDAAVTSPIYADASDDALSEADHHTLSSIRRVAVYFTGRSSKDVPKGSCAISSALAGKRSRMITLLPGEEITVKLLEDEGDRAFGQAVVVDLARYGQASTPRVEPLRAGYLRRRDGGQRAHPFRSDGALRAFLVRQVQRAGTMIVPVVQLFPLSSFGKVSIVTSPSDLNVDAAEAPHSPTEVMVRQMIAHHIDAALEISATSGTGDEGDTVMSPFLRPKSALGLSTDTPTVPGDEAPSPSGALVVRPPRPPSAASTTPQRPTRSSAMSGEVSATTTFPLGVRSVSVVASKVTLDDAAINAAFAEVQDIEGQPSADGMVDVAAVLTYLNQNYFSLGDTLRFVRLLPDRCQGPYWTSEDGSSSPVRPRSARPVSARRRQEEAALPTTRMSFDEFALTMLRVAKS